MTDPSLHSAELTTLPLDAFWDWLSRHCNCILRAGTADAILCDDEDLHWYVGADGQRLFAQVIRGKRLMGEMALDPERISYVEALPEERGEFVFELIDEGEMERSAPYYFVMAHAFDDETEGADVHGQAVH